MTEQPKGNECDCECFDCSEDGFFNHCQGADCLMIEYEAFEIE